MAACLKIKKLIQFKYFIRGLFALSLIIVGLDSKNLYASDYLKFSCREECANNSIAVSDIWNNTKLLRVSSCSEWQDTAEDPISTLPICSDDLFSALQSLWNNSFPIRLDVLDNIVLITDGLWTFEGGFQEDPFGDDATKNSQLPRTKMAKLMKLLAGLAPRAVVIDKFFPNNDRPGTDRLEEIFGAIYRQKLFPVLAAWPPIGAPEEFYEYLETASILVQHSAGGFGSLGTLRLEACGSRSDATPYTVGTRSLRLPRAKCENQDRVLPLRTLDLLGFDFGIDRIWWEPVASIRYGKEVEIKNLPVPIFTTDQVLSNAFDVTQLEDKLIINGAAFQDVDSFQIHGFRIPGVYAQLLVINHLLGR